MKYISKLLLISSLTFISLALQAQQNYVFKGKFLMGGVLPTPGLSDINIAGPIVGGEFSWEILPLGDDPYQYYWNFPSYGLSLMFIDYGNPSLLGQAINIYPYLSLPFVNNKEFSFNFKIGAGFSIQTKPNPIIPSYVSIFGTMSLEATFKFKKGWGMFAEAGVMGINNCNFVLPKQGLVGAFGAVGMRYHMDERRYRAPRQRYMRGLPWNIAFNITISAGIQDYYMFDNSNPLFATFNINAVRRITNCYALGGGLDLIYDTKFVPQGKRDDQSFKEFTNFNRYFIEKNSVAMKFRAGVSITNQFMIGRVTAFADVGIYLYDPLRDAYPDPHPTHGYKRPMVYAYDVRNEDGWCYFKVGARVRLVENFAIQAAVRSHLYMFEYFELGLSYTIPQKRRLQI